MKRDSVEGNKTHRPGCQVLDEHHFHQPLLGEGLRAGGGVERQELRKNKFL